MKKLTILAGIAVMALAACTKVAPEAQTQKEVTFQVANYVQTKANVVYGTDNHFGTYAWFTATDKDLNEIADPTQNSYSDHSPFMVNEEVWFATSIWRTKNQTYYWPKTGTLDFISYSPFNGNSGTADSNPVVSKSAAHAYKLNYTAAGASAIANTDYMYADKVTCRNDNQNDQTGNITIEKDETGANYTGAQYTGVPTLFRHALAKLSFNVKPTFLTYTETIDATTDPVTTSTTTWKVTVKHVYITGFYTEGTCELNWALDPADNQYKWIKPENEVWTVTDGAAQTVQQDLVSTAIVFDPDATSPNYFDPTDPDNYPAKALGNTTNLFVMPQNFVAGKQTLAFDIDIETTLANGNTITENYTKTLDFAALTGATPRIKMNQNLTYNLLIKPTAYKNTNDAPTDVVINFDPAVSDWDPVSVDLNIIL